MFSSKTQLQKRTPENGTDRESFLSLLVDEYLHSSSYDAKCQVLANLANFAYDPINYQYIRDVGVLDIFLHVIKNESSHQLLHFASAGICNLSCDPLNAEYIITQSGLKPIIALLKSSHDDILADTITTLYYLNNNQTKAEITTTEVIKHIRDIQKSNDKRLKICKIHTTTFSNTAFKAGDKIRIQKTLTQKDLDAFSNLTSDHNYLHQNNGNKRPIVHGALLNGLVAGLIGTHLPGPGTVLVSQTMKFPNKCFVGEKLTISVELVDVRKILKVKFYCIVEEEKKVVFEGEAKLMLAKDC
uniref:MaoC-like domain-containing protein n=1 Tax=Heliothis virescens TaxID=7102 RepID=A0A2A4K3W2_HELVI